MCRVSATAGILLTAVACVAGAAVDPGKATAPRMEFVPPPPGVTREGIRAGRREMLDAWWDALGLGTAAWWRTWKK